MMGLSGSWFLYSTPQGQPEEGPYCMTIIQTGNSLNITIDGSSGSGSINGNQISVQLNDCDNQRTITSTGTVEGNSMSGTYVSTICPNEPEEPLTGTWRAVRGECTLLVPLQIASVGIAKHSQAKQHQQHTISMEKQLNP
jgi:hypothetical protein